MIGWEELLRRLRHNDFLVSRTTRAGGPGEGGPTTLGVLDARAAIVRSAASDGPG